MKDASRHRVWVMSAEYEPYISGGLGTVATNLTQEFVGMCMDVTVITASPWSAVSVTRKPYITIVRFPKNYSAHKITTYLRAKGFQLPQVILIHSLEYAPLLDYYKFIPAVYTCHSLVLRRGNSRVFTPVRQARLLHHAARIVVPSGSECARLVRCYPFCADKATVIGHGVRVHTNDTTTASKYDLLYAGRLVKKKGLEQLIDAMNLITRKYPQAQLFAIGSGKAPYVATLKRRAMEKGVSRVIHWLGKYKHGQLQSAYKRFGAVVMPSRAESFGLVALEALAHGIPLVATRVGGLAQFVSHDVAQVITRVDGESIASAIQTMWETPDSTALRVVTGRRLALNYQWPQAGAKYAEILTNVARSR